VKPHSQQNVDMHAQSYNVRSGHGETRVAPGGLDFNGDNEAITLIEPFSQFGQIRQGQHSRVEICPRSLLLILPSQILTRSRFALEKFRAEIIVLDPAVGVVEAIR
jgi:hypothetical protein